MIAGPNNMLNPPFLTPKWDRKGGPDDSFMFFTPFYVSMLGRFWKLLKAKSWFWRHLHVFMPFYGRPGCNNRVCWNVPPIFDPGIQPKSGPRQQFHVFKQFYVSVLGRFWRLLRAKSWFWRHYTFLNCFMDGLDATNEYVGNVPPIFDPEMGAVGVLLVS